MDQNWQQGGDPNRRAAYHNPEQRHDDLPSSSSRRPPLQQGFSTSWPEQQAQVGGYIGNQRAPDVVAGIPPDGNISDNNHLAPLACPIPPGPSYPDSDAMVTGPPMQNVIGGQDQYQRHSDSAIVFLEPDYDNPIPSYPPGAAVYAQQCGSGTVFDAPGYGRNPHASSVFQPPAAPLYAQPGDATDFSAWAGNASSNPYTSAAGLIPPPANANQGASASHGPVAAVPNRTCLALQNVRANNLWIAVNHARTPGALETIVNIVINSRASLFEVAQHNLGYTALMKLANLAALSLDDPEVLQRLFRCLIKGWIMEQNGPILLQHFFTTLGYARCSIFIHELAVPRFREMVTSRIEHMSIMLCLDTEQRTELHDMIVNYTVVVAKYMFGSILLQTVFERGHNNELKERIRQRVEENLVELSLDQYGNGVVQACFFPSRMTPASPVLQRGLHAFLRLPGEQLQELVLNRTARYVLCRLLRYSLYMQRPVPSAEALQLASRIFIVLGAGDEDMRTGMLNHLVLQVIYKSNP